MSTTTGTGPVTTPSSTSSTSTSTAIGLIPFQPITTSPTTTSSSSSTSSAAGSSSSSSSSTSSNTSGSSSSSSTPTTTARTTPTTSTTNQNIFTPTTSALPAVITEVSTTVVSESTTSTASAAAVKNAATNGFFSNKAAVAGVFTIVGLIGVVILVFLLLNAIRRHRAKQFDNELFAATREAAAVTANPNLLDDDDDDESKDRLKHNGYGPAYGNGYGGTYSSDGSHGAYGPPLEAFGMRDIVAHSVPVGEIYDPYAAGGAAGIGVARARSAKANLSQSTPNIYAAALQAGGSPYPKFAIPPKPEGGAGAPLGRGNSYNPEFGASHDQRRYHQESQEYPTLGRTKSDPTRDPQVSSLTRAPTYPQPQNSVPPASLPNPYNLHTVQSSGSTNDDGAAYGGYVDEADEEVVEMPKRVLKVANES